MYAIIPSTAFPKYTGKISRISSCHLCPADSLTMPKFTYIASKGRVASQALAPDDSETGSQCTSSREAQLTFLALTTVIHKRTHTKNHTSSLLHLQVLSRHPE